MRSMSTIEHTNFDEFIERGAKVVYGDLGVGDLILGPSMSKHCDSA